MDTKFCCICEFYAKGILWQIIFDCSAAEFKDAGKKSVHSGARNSCEILMKLNLS